MKVLINIGLVFIIVYAIMLTLFGVILSQNLSFAEGFIIFLGMIIFDLLMSLKNSYLRESQENESKSKS